MGLTDGDFARDPYRRYGLSALDEIDTEHRQLVFRYNWDLSERIGLSAVVYNNEFERDWFKTEGIDFNGSLDASSFDRTSWSSVIRAVNLETGLDGFSANELQGILDGTRDTLPGSIQIRSNAREYFSRGIQLGLDWQLETADIAHNLTFGLRLHEDEEDRLQRNSSYSQVDGRLLLDDRGLLGNAGNRIQEAQAIAVHLYDQMRIGKWTVAPGLRFESIEQKRTRYEIRDGLTLDPASREADNLRDVRKNDTQVWLPGLGIAYGFTEELSAFGGVHKGFSAPSNAPNVDAEEALNYELGLRFERDALKAELAFFYSDYDNLLGECTASSGSDCEIGDAFNGDAATVQGVEFLLASKLNPRGRLSVPFDISYTYINGEFDTDIADTDFFGDVSAGDPVPYLPDHQLTLTVGLEGIRWDAFVSANYVAEVCTRAACGEFEKTDDSIVVDVAGRYRMSDDAEVFARVENLFGAEDIVARQPYGARPNKDVTASLGVRFSF